MKKIIALLLAVVFLFTAVSCNKTPDAPPHVHEFVYSEEASTAVTCTTAGVEVKVCSCGQTQETPVAATGHSLKLAMEGIPSCTETATTTYRCTKCGKMERTTHEATGHNFEESSSEPSRVVRCLNEDCSSCKWVTTSNGTHTEALTFNFTKEDEAEIEALYEKIKTALESSDRYDPALHGYTEEGALAESATAISDDYNEFYSLLKNVASQRQLAMIYYYCDMKNEELEETYKYMMDYYTDLVSKFYSFARPFYDSCYREFYYYGMTEEEVNAFLFDADAVSNPEYTALKERNNAIEAEFKALSSTEKTKQLPALYAEFAANNNKMAQIMGYENYLEYAYENVRFRDYTYQDAAVLSEYVKTYLAPVFNQIRKMYQGTFSSSAVTDKEKERYNNQAQHSFFTNLEGNTYVNDYIDLLAFTSNPDKQYSFSDEFNKLMGDGNMFRGKYQGAFVTTISGVNIPVAYFSAGYDSANTIVHEFGHYMNELYSLDVALADPNFIQSYDLLEMHSQGNEILYLCYLEENVDYSEIEELLIRLDILLNMFAAVISGSLIDSFEQAIYLDTYSGHDAAIIMADGTITVDEYKTLYASICKDYGVEDSFGTYWEYGMTITSPCYYVSYSVSAISVLQLYEMAKSDGFDAAKEAYLKLFTYVDENPSMEFEDILEYAGLQSFMNEEIYITLNEYFTK